ncbi:hypothetical protein ACHAXT_012106 [Thalassiosira profunda]
MAMAGSEDAGALMVGLHAHQLLSCAVALVVTWWWWRRRSSATKPSAVEHDNGCNNPNCLRCHSSSRRHVDAFKANATMLRRLVKLEPGLFEDISPGLWNAVEERERSYEREERLRSGYLIQAILTMRQFWESWRTISPEEETVSTTPLSPQEGQDPTVFMMPGLASIPLHDANHCERSCPCARLWESMPRDKTSPPIPVTGDIEALQQSYDTIRTELLSYLRSSSDSFQAFDPNVYRQASTANSKGNHPEWSSVYLYRQGIRQSETCNEYFSQTTGILESKCPHLIGGKCGLGSVYYSKLQPNTKVKEHCGPTNVRWRCHLPLVVPEAKSGEESSCLKVGLPGVSEQCVGWEEGVPILFDDSFLHSAVHCDCESERIVLIVDFWHPTLTDSDRTALGILYPPGQ